MVARSDYELFPLSSYLLDQLMRYEPVLLSDDEERDDLTDISASEDEQMYSDPLFGSQVGGSVQHVITLFRFYYQLLCYCSLFILAFTCRPSDCEIVWHPHPFCYPSLLQLCTPASLKTSHF